MDGFFPTLSTGTTGSDNGTNPTFRDDPENLPICRVQGGLSTVSTSPTAITILISYLIIMLELNL